MRTLFRPFAIHAAYSPIETIVFFSIIGTLAYFHILTAIKHSSFFAPSHSHPALRPSHALLRKDEWINVRENVWFRDDVVPVEVQQIIFTVEDTGLGGPDVEYLVAESVGNLTTHLIESKTYSTVCHRSPVTANLSGDAPCFSAHTASPTTYTQTLTFVPGTREDFMAGLVRSSSAVDGYGVKYEIETRQVETIGDMKGTKWVAYAARAFVMRFWDLAKVRASSIRRTLPDLCFSNSLESRFSRHPSHPRRLHSDAHDIRPPLLALALSRIQFLAAIGHNILLRPRSSPRVTHCYVVEDPHGPSSA